MIRERCIICDKEFIKIDKPRKSRSSAEVTRYFRQSNAITCSKNCSKRYRLIYHRIMSKYFNQKIRERSKSLVESK